MIRHIATVNAGTCISPDLVLLATSLDDLADRSDAKLARLRFFDASDKTEPWGNADLAGWHVESAAALSAKVRAIVDEEGQYQLFGPGGKPIYRSTIPDAGVFREGAAGYGYVGCIRAIGRTLYVCGSSRQVYRYVFSDGGPPLAGQFIDIAGAMRQPPLRPPSQPSGPEFDAWSTRDIVVFNDIGGSGETDLYAVGDECWHFNGSTWRQLQLGDDLEPMHVVKILDAQRVLIGGRNGYLFLGNAREGFQSLVGAEDNATITGLEWFDEQLFVATDQGLFTLDVAARRLQRFRTGLKPELQDAHQLQAMDGVLWSFGYKDLAYCDTRNGQRGWIRVQHPDNPPIGSPGATRHARSAAHSAPTDAAQRAAGAQQALARWLPPRGQGPVDVAGLISRVGHRGVGGYVCEQLAAMKMAPDAVLQFARTKRYELAVPQLGLTLKLQYTGRKVALADPHAHPELWALAGLELQSDATNANGGWTGPWPGGLQPQHSNWAQQANAIWGEPGFRSSTAQTHFISGAGGAALALMLIHESGARLERLRIECMGEYVGG